MVLKKQHLAENEKLIFDGTFIYQPGKYAHFRMWLPKENMYACKSQRSLSETSAIKKGKTAYLEIYDTFQQCKTYFSIPSKEIVEKHLSFRMRDVEFRHIVTGQHTIFAFYLKYFLGHIGKDTRLKEIERTDYKNYFYHGYKATNGYVKQLIIKTKQNIFNALSKFLYKNERHKALKEIKHLCKELGGFRCHAERLAS